MGNARGRGGSYLLDHRVLDSNKAVNQLLKEGYEVGWTTQGFTSRCQLVLFAFRPQNRAQTHGTFKLFFNALYYGQAEMDSGR